MDAVDGRENDTVLVGNVALAGSGRFARLSDRGGTIYAAADDQEPERDPDRGLVAVIEIDEADCGETFDKVIDGCVGCEDADHVVVIAHIEGYPYDKVNLPPIRDSGLFGRSHQAFRMIGPS